MLRWLDELSVVAKERILWVLNALFLAPWVMLVLGGALKRLGV